MKKGDRRARITVKAGVFVDAAFNRITFADDQMLIWEDDVETGRFTVTDLLSLDFRVEASKPSPEAVRAVHRNAYAKWTSEEDALLLDLARKSTSVPDIAALFGRQESAIDSRLAKLSVQLLTVGDQGQHRDDSPRASVPVGRS
jgi:hypothetical protein